MRKRGPPVPSSTMLITIAFVDARCEAPASASVNKRSVQRLVACDALAASGTIGSLPVDASFGDEALPALLV